jgi:BON domain
MTDSEIEQWVLRELQFAGNIQSRELCVSAHRGIVTLGGTVPNRISRTAAKRAALRARGVKSVINNLRAKSRIRLIEPSLAPAAVRAVTQLQPPVRPLADPSIRIY